MFHQPMKSSAQHILDIVSKRTVLTEDQQKLLERLAAGYEGEMYFFKKLKAKLNNNPITLYNLYLKLNGSHFQIDCLLIFQNEIIIFEIKHYRGDFFIENNNWYTLAKREIKNPIHQLQRTELMLRQFLNKHKSALKIRSFLIFNHPEFFLYQVSPQTPIVFHGQLRPFIQQFKNIPCKIQQHHNEIASLLKSNHQSSSSFEYNTIYDYDSLKKGVICQTCNGFMVEDKRNNMRCVICGDVEDLRHAMIRTIKDYRILFPTNHIRIKSIIDWTNNSVSIYKTRKIIEEFAVLVPRGKNSYYLFNEPDACDQYV